MNILKATTMTVLATAMSFSALADTDHQHEEAVEKSSSQMPMMGGKQGGMPMMKMMQEKQAMMQAHMKKMETHMANMEALLRELVELQKQK